MNRRTCTSIQQHRNIDNSISAGAGVLVAAAQVQLLLHFLELWGALVITVDHPYSVQQAVVSCLHWEALCLAHWRGLLWLQIICLVPAVLASVRVSNRGNAPSLLKSFYMDCTLTFLRMIPARTCFREVPIQTGPFVRRAPASMRHLCGDVCFCMGCKIRILV